jgi:hypothetical protein
MVRLRGFAVWPTAGNDIATDMRRAHDRMRETSLFVAGHRRRGVRGHGDWSQPDDHDDVCSTHGDATMTSARGKVDTFTEFIVILPRGMFADADFVKPDRASFQVSDTSFRGAAQC